MRIDRLTVQNFRCFENFTLKLDPRCNVLIGENASGKTALLDALAMSLVPIVGALHRPNRSMLLITSRDARLQTVVVHGIQRSEARPHVRVQAEFQLYEKRLEVEQSSIPDSWDVCVREVVRIREVLGEKADRAFPLAAWIPTERFEAVNSANSDVGQFQLGDRQQGYRDALRPQMTVANLREWMSWRSNANNAAVVKQLKAGFDPEELQSPELRAITDVVAACIPGAQHFSYNADHERLEVEFDDGRLLPFSILSSGYQSFLALVADLAWRCWQLNPQFDDAAPKETDGVVLIDEIDLHLHPQWQREVLGRLLDAFPKIQFVVTTHSPQVIASAEPEWLRILTPDHDEALRVEHTHGKDSNAILRQIMGVPDRPEWMRQKLLELARQIDDDQFDDARKLLDEITEDLGVDDPKVVGLEWELSMAQAGIDADD